VSANSHANREAKIIAGTRCPVCGAPAGERCREGVSEHDPRRGVEDLRPFLGRVHTGRRLQWVENNGRCRKGQS
jgi:hypothetical protein